METLHLIKRRKVPLIFDHLAIQTLLQENHIENQITFDNLKEIYKKIYSSNDDLIVGSPYWYEIRDKLGAMMKRIVDN